MKRIHNLILSAGVALSCVLLSACNDIDSNDRFVELPKVDQQRVVLLEEFTGQFCVNCPDAHKAIKKLLQQYDGDLIAVSIHAGGNSFSIGEDEMPGVVGLRLPEGEAYASAAGVSGLPCGVVNRATGVQTSDDWGSSIRAQVQRPANLAIALEAKLSEDGKSIEITTEVDPYDNISANLQLWVVESGIIALQMLRDGSVDVEYEHNHVFRGCVNGLSGEPVQLTTREPQTFSHTIDLKPNWNPANLSIVAFLYDTTGVLQAAEAEVD